MEETRYILPLREKAACESFLLKNLENRARLKKVNLTMSSLN